MKTECSVVIPVFNGLHVARPCFESVMRWTDLDRFEVLLVNDGSDAHTSAVLDDWTKRHASVRLLENPSNMGFVRSCNRGLAAVEADFAVLLNSDTCVTPRWLDKMVDCMTSDERIAIASPISNFAPHMKIEMAPGLDYLAMAALVEELSLRAYPDITTPEGFCFMIRMSFARRHGFFDPVFDDGYGEESDISMRANYRGYRTVCVDDTYIYHRGRGTFGQERRDLLYQRNKSVFHDRWGARYPEQFAEFRQRDPLKATREAIAGLHGDRQGAFER